MKLLNRLTFRKTADPRDSDEATKTPTAAETPVAPTRIEALEKAVAAHQLRPDDETTTVRLAVALSDLGGMRRAQELLRPFIDGPSPKRWTVATAARAAMAEQSFDKAKALWRRVQEIDAESIPAQLNLAEIARDQGDYSLIKGPLAELEREAASKGCWLSLDVLENACDQRPDDKALRVHRDDVLRRRYGLSPADFYGAGAGFQQDAGAIAGDAGAAVSEETAQTDRDCIERARRLMSEGRYEAALAELPLVGELRHCADYRSRRRSILLHLGRQRAAAIEAIHAFRACSSTVNFAILVGGLDLLGKKAAAAGLLESVREMAEASAAWSDALSRVAAGNGDFVQALRFARRSIDIGPTNYLAHRTLALALWLNGETEASWRRYLAIVIDRPLAAHEEHATGVADAFKARVEAAMGALGDDVGADQLIHLRREIANPWLMKLERRLDDAERAVVTAIRDAEPTALAAVKDAEDLFAAAVDFANRYSEPAKLGHMMRRLADVLEAAGHLGLARKTLERVVWIEKDRRLNLSKLQQFNERNAPHLVFREGEARTVALMVSCKPNLDRVVGVAKAFAARSGLPVVTLSADEGLDLPTLEMRDYGRHLTVPGDDQYLGLAQKMNAAFRYLAWNSNCEAALKVDDDTAIQSTERFGEMMSLFDTPEVDYAGVRSQFKNSVFHNGRHRDQHELRFAHHTPREYANGANGYYVSRRSLIAIAQYGISYFADWRNDAIYEDVFFGEILSEAGVQLTDFNMMARGGLIADVFEASALARRLGEA